MELARHLLWREQTGRLELLPENVSGVRDGADAKSNIEDTADGKPAKRSAYGNAPGGTVYLSLSLLGGLKALTREFEFAITSIAGGSHSVGSNHYRGVSVDVDTINGQRVSAAHPTYRYFMQRAEELGATERYGPGDRGHSGHIHLSW